MNAIHFRLNADSHSYRHEGTGWVMFRYPEAVRRILEALAGESRGIMVGGRKFWVQPSQREFDLSGMLKDI